MNSKSIRGALWLVSLLTVAAAACSLASGDGPPSNAVVVNVVANSSLGNWLTAAVERFNEAEIETVDVNRSGPRCWPIKVMRVTRAIVPAWQPARW